MQQIRRKFCDFIVMILWLICLCMLTVGCRSGENQEDTFTGTVVEEETVIAEEEGAAGDSGSEENEAEENDLSGSEAGVIYVYICGQVAEPGVYELREGDRITDAVCAAGGMTDSAAQTYLNQAALLEDGQKIYVPTEEEADQLLTQGEAGSSTGAGQAVDAADDGKVNLNTADKAELMTLSGIGESRAEAILAYRQEHGSFESIEDIKNIEGIKEGIFNRIKDQLTV